MTNPLKFDDTAKARNFKFVDPPPEIQALDFTGLLKAVPRAHASYKTHNGQLRRWKVWAGGIWVIADLRTPWTARLYTSTWAVRGRNTDRYEVTSFGGSVEDCERDFVILRVSL